MPQDLFAPANAKPLTRELVACRQRGLDRLDFVDRHHRRVEMPLLDQLAYDYHTARGLGGLSRARAIHRLIIDAMRACEARGDIDTSRFVAMVFFVKVEPHETTGKQKEGVQTIRRAKAMAAFNLTEDDYDRVQSLRFSDFATFLLAFVAATVAASAAQNESVTAPAETDEPRITEAMDPPVTTASSLYWWQRALTRVGQHRRLTVTVGGLVLLLVVAIVIILVRPSTHQPLSAAVATKTATRSIGSAVGAQSMPPHIEMAGQYGAPTFTDPHTPSVSGTPIEPYQQVQVACKVYAPTIPSASPDGYWYRIASAPWNGRYYAVANTFMNGDTVGGPSLHNTDFAVPDCSG